VRVTKHWQKLLGAAVDSLSLEIFKTQLDNQLEVALLEQGVWMR